MATSPRILLVDDDSAVLDFLQFVIAAHFPTAQIITCTDGYSFLTAYQQYGADLFILDHRLPDVIGSALLQYLRDTGVTTPAILLSGVLAREVVTPEMQAFFVAKPCTVKEFVSTITTALAGATGATGAVLTASRHYPAVAQDR